MNYMKNLLKDKATFVIVLKILGTLVLCLYLYSCVVAPDIFFLKNHNPELTQMMKYRIRQAKKANREYVPKYRFVPLNQMSPYLVQAVLIAEDGSFYSHGGFDLRAIYDSFGNNLKRRKFAFGGSTITMQLAKNLYLNPKKSIFRKALEAMITFRLERNLSKARILELYLNYIEWAPQQYGANYAAYYYFNKSVSELSKEEAVFLATMIPAPLSYGYLKDNPYLRERFIHVAYYMDLLHQTPIDLNYRFPDISDAQKQEETEIEPTIIFEMPQTLKIELNSTANVSANVTANATSTLNIHSFPDALPTLKFKSPLQ